MVQRNWARMIVFMKITALAENLPSVAGCEAEHGLSLWIETQHHCLLMDTGASALFASNAAKLGIDLSQAEMLIISHGHYDHAGGVMTFAAAYPQTPVYLRRSAQGEFYSTQADGSLHYIGIDPAIASLPQTVWADGTLPLSDSLTLFGDIKQVAPQPPSNRRLYRKNGDSLEQDIFDHEQCLLIRENGKTVLLSGCAHNGVINILERCREVTGSLPDAVISGFHMKKSSPYTEEEWRSIADTAALLKEYPCHFYTCHCTGQPAYELMKTVMGDKLHYLACGETIQP